MAKNKVFLIALMMLTISLSSCGIFRKGCGCPPVSKIKTSTGDIKGVNV